MTDQEWEATRALIERERDDARRQVADLERRLLEAERKIIELEDQQAGHEAEMAATLLLEEQLDEAERALGLDRAAPIDRWMALHGRYERARQ